MVRAMAGAGCLALALAMPVQEAAAQENILGGALFGGTAAQPASWHRRSRARRANGTAAYRLLLV